MRFESEVVAEEILPAVRKTIATRLLKEYGYKQEEIAAKLDVTQPAVSQYIQGKRASSNVVEKLTGDPQIDIIIDDAVSNAAQSKDFTGEIQRIVSNVRDKGLLREKFEDADRII